MANAVSIGGTGVASFDGLLSGWQWSGLVTYSFPDSAGDYIAGYGSETAAVFAQVSFEQRNAVRHILDGTGVSGNGSNYGNVAGITNLSFAELGLGSGGADMMIAQSSDADPTAFAYYPSNAAAGGDVWFGAAYDFRDPELGSYSYATHLHEIGHALGLKHGHETGGVSDIRLPDGVNSLEYTIMTYRSYAGGPDGPYANEEFGYPTTFMMLDIAALQIMYGADFSYNASNTSYTWSPTTGEMFVNGAGQGAPGANRVFLTIWDGGGTDTYDLSNYGSNLRLDLNPGQSSLLSPVQQANLGNGNLASGNVYNALQYPNDPRSLIENAIGGTGNDWVQGNAASNLLRGGDGFDTLFGAAGADLIYGNRGNDLIYGNQDADAVFAGQGADVVFGGRGADLIYGNFENDLIYGNFESDILFGGQGNDTAYGGQGDDLIVGNLGDDLLFGNLGADRFVFGSNSGTDRLRDFNPGQGDRISLQGQAFTIRDTAEGMALDLSGGGSVLLFGIEPGGFSTTYLA